MTIQRITDRLMRMNYLQAIPYLYLCAVVTVFNPKTHRAVVSLINSIANG